MSEQGGSVDNPRTQRHRRHFIALIVIAVIAVATIIGLYLVSPRQDAQGDLRKRAEQFPVPSGVTKAAPDSATSSPRSYTMHWRQAQALEQACATWSESLRAWKGGTNELGNISGEIVPGVSCTFSVEKDGFSYRLVGNAYEGPSTTRVSVTVKRASDPKR